MIISDNFQAGRTGLKFRKTVSFFDTHSNIVGFDWGATETSLHYLINRVLKQQVIQNGRPLTPLLDDIVDMIDPIVLSND